MTPTLADTLRMKLLRAENEARVVILEGAGEAFCAGANLSDLINDPELLADGGLVLKRHYNPLVRAIRDLRIPLITAVRGAAAGFGASIALLGDIIVASETAYFVQSFRHVGLVPNGGLPFILSRAAGRVRAMELMLLAEKLKASDALAWGLVTRVVAENPLDPTVETIAQDLAAGAPFSIGQTCKLAWAATQSSLDDALDLEVETQRRAVATNDFQVSVRAFI